MINGWKESPSVPLIILHSSAVHQSSDLSLGDKKESRGSHLILVFSIFSNGQDFSRLNWELATHRILFTRRHKGGIGWGLDQEAEKQAPDPQSILTEATAKNPSSLPLRQSISHRALGICTYLKQWSIWHLQQLCSQPARGQMSPGQILQGDNICDRALTVSPSKQLREDFFWVTRKFNLESTLCSLRAQLRWWVFKN